MEKAQGTAGSMELQLTGTAARGEATFLFPAMVLDTRGHGKQLTGELEAAL
jgi:hypothetical protein